MVESPKSSRKNPIHQLMQALQARLSHVVSVIDDALHSENLRDRIWAVEQLLKRLSPEATPATPKAKVPPNLTKLRTMSDTDLHAAIAELLQDDPYEAKPKKGGTP